MPYPLPEQIRAARKADLGSFLLRHCPESVIMEGDSLRLTANHSVCIRIGWSGWKDWADGRHGNPIDFLMEFAGCRFQDAVLALCRDIALGPVSLPATAGSGAGAGPTAAAHPFAPPAPVQGPWRRVYAYLNQTRGIPVPLIQKLVDSRMLYQDGRGNAVFLNPEQTFYEIRGTLSSVPFHQVKSSEPDAFWWFLPETPDPHTFSACICESAIDALSLYLLRRETAPDAGGSIYVSIGGVANQQRIDRIRTAMDSAGCRTVIAVDSDAAGQNCRNRNPDCPALIPVRKDWNEDWLALQGRQK